MWGSREYGLIAVVCNMQLWVELEYVTGPQGCALRGYKERAILVQGDGLMLNFLDKLNSVGDAGEGHDRGGGDILHAVPFLCGRRVNL